MATRRLFIKSMAAAALGTVLPGSIRPVAAGVSAKDPKQTPGYFRQMIGEIEVTTLYDGGVRSDPKLLHGINGQELADLLATACYAGADGRYPTSINAFLVNTGDSLLLVDTGAGAYFGKLGGRLAASIREAGYRPEQIDAILLTHLHSDHALGLVDAAGKPLFPQARVRVSAAEVEYWLRDGAETRVNEGQRKVLPALRAALAPYQATGKLLPFAFGEAPAPGVEAVPLTGHTPSHCGYRLRSKDESILFWGDLVHCLPVQFPRPAVSIDYDTDQPAAVTTREALFSRLAPENGWVAGAHLPFPGLGHIRPAGPGFVWWPAIIAPPSA